MKGRAALLILLVTVCSPAAAAETEARAIALDDLRHLADLSDARISPDGTKIVVVVSRPDYEENRFASELLLVETETGSQRPLTHNRPLVGSPQWSPGGDRIAFLDRQAETDKAQLYLLSIDGGEAKRITSAPRGVSLYEWRPDGRELAFVTEDEPATGTGEERHNKSFEVGDNGYLATAAAMPSHVWTVPAEGGQAVRLTSGAESIGAGFGGSIAWSPDGRFLAFTSQERPHTAEFDRRSLKVLEIGSGATRTIVPGPTIIDSVRFSPRGTELTYSHPTGPGPGFNPAARFAVAFSGGEPRNLTPEIDRDVSVEFMPDGNSLLVAANDGTRVSLWSKPLAGAARKLAIGGVDPTSRISIAANAPGLAFVGVEPEGPEELYFMAAVDAAPRRLTSLNSEVASRRFGATESVAWKGPDGFDENGVLTLPPDFDPKKKYPLVLHIHGGPMGTSLEGFSAFRHILAARGWLVFSPNYRGSNNMGRAFQRAVVNDAGDGPGRDVMAGVAAVKASFPVDETRLGVSGWSYGGFMTAWLTAHFDGWAAAVSGAAVTDWFDWYDLADMNVWAGYGLGGSPWRNDNAENYWRQSPIRYAAKIETPTLILSNTGDPRVTVTQSYKLYHALKDNGVKVQFIAYPIGGHFPADPVHQRDVYRRWIDWFELHFSAAASND
jgi:dipeptidyl aminopeptidase/acylaminoacyl peptidase